MKKRDILREVQTLRIAVNEAKAKLADADLTDLASRIGWLHERVDLLFTRLEAMRGDITLDDAAAKRLTFAVGQFSARLDRLEQPMTVAPPPPKPRRRRRPKPEPTPSGAPQETAK